jgi:hypothetical protein
MHRIIPHGLVEKKPTVLAQVWEIIFSERMENSSCQVNIVKNRRKITII